MDCAGVVIPLKRERLKKGIWNEVTCRREVSTRGLTLENEGREIVEGK